MQPEELVEVALVVPGRLQAARAVPPKVLNIDEENKVGGKLTVWFRSLLSLLGEPT